MRRSPGSRSPSRGPRLRHRSGADARSGSFSGRRCGGATKNKDDALGRHLAERVRSRHSRSRANDRVLLPVAVDRFADGERELISRGSPYLSDGGFARALGLDRTTEHVRFCAEGVEQQVVRFRIENASVLRLLRFLIAWCIRRCPVIAP